MGTRQTLVNAMVTAVIVRTFPCYTLHGIRVVFTDLRIDRDQGKTRLGEAFALLAETDPRRHGQLVRYCRNIVIWGGHYTAASPLNDIRLGVPHLMDTSALELASTLVHEVTHLRIARYRIRYDQDSSERIERRCIAEQAAFLREQGSEGQAMAELIMESLSDPWWTDEARRGDVDRLVLDAGLPRWTVPFMNGIRRIIR